MINLDAFTPIVIDNLAFASLQATACILVILLLQRLLGEHLRPGWRYALWTVVLLRLLVPITFEVPLIHFRSTAPVESVSEPPSTVPRPFSDSQVQETLATSESTDAPAAAAPTTSAAIPIDSDAPAPARISLASFAFATWAVGACALFLVVVSRHMLAMRRILRDADPAPEWVMDTLRDTRRDIDVSVWPVVLVADRVAAPVIVGALRPKILLPRSAVDAISREDLHLILAHELVHLRRFDLWFSWLWLIANALHWFNPAVWWAAARARRDREEACDETVLRRLAPDNRLHYGHVLVDALSHAKNASPMRVPGAAAIVESPTQLERRLTMIKHFVPIGPGHYATGIVTAAAIALVAFVHFWAYSVEQPVPVVKVANQSDAIPENPFADIDDEAELGRIRDEAARNNDLIRAIDAEMRRVKLRDETGHAYKDKIDLVQTYSMLPTATDDTEQERRMQVLADYGHEHPDPDYTWRISHLLAHIAGSAGDMQLRRDYLEQALAEYPRVVYRSPAQHSKFQHLVNELAMVIWDLDGVAAAEKFVVKTWQDDRRFAYFFDPPWAQRYESSIGNADRLAALRGRLGDKPPLKEVRILLTPKGLQFKLDDNPYNPLYNWKEFASIFDDPQRAFDYYLAMGYTSDETTLKEWKEARAKAVQLVQSTSIQYFSDIGLQTGREAERFNEKTASVRDRFKQLGLAFKMYAHESRGETYPPVSTTRGHFIPEPGTLFPEYSPDPDLRVLFNPENPDRAIYFGYLVADTMTAHAFLDAYEERGPAAFSGQDLTVEPGEGVNQTDTIFRLREGIERFLITDINDINAAGAAQSKIPIAWELPQPNTDSGLVLYLDGHVSEVSYPGPFPMNQAIVERVRRIMNTTESTR